MVDAGSLTDNLFKSLVDPPRGPTWLIKEGAPVTFLEVLRNFSLTLHNFG